MYNSYIFKCLIKCLIKYINVCLIFSVNKIFVIRKVCNFKNRPFSSNKKNNKMNRDSSYVDNISSYYDDDNNNNNNNNNNKLFIHVYIKLKYNFM
ncbi:hypothetical protein PFNF54_00683 [Plasmodium falciparum NF54]|uniref:Uncharacterized protein n=1 Tax=Plasmodium falciparum (isolate NF54) TaxID=5843 RepID=W7KA60_PLAFO|nr:hypothetical protein PFNF54_00683 [Plasmodium falciparum NF54]